MVAWIKGQKAADEKDVKPMIAKSSLNIAEICSLPSPDAASQLFIKIMLSCKALPVTGSCALVETLLIIQSAHHLALHTTMLRHSTSVTQIRCSHQVCVPG